MIPIDPRRLEGGSPSQLGRLSTSLKPLRLEREIKLPQHRSPRRRLEGGFPSQLGRFSSLLRRFSSQLGRSAARYGAFIMCYAPL